MEICMQYLDNYPIHVKTLWQYYADGRIYSTPAIGAGKIYFGTEDGKIHCVDVGNGNVVWTYPTGDWVWSSPAIAYDTVLFGSMDGNFYAVDINTGGEVYKFNVGSPIRSSPAVANGCVYFGADNGKFYALKSKVPPPPPPTGIEELIVEPSPFDQSGDNKGTQFEKAFIKYKLVEDSIVTIQIIDSNNNLVKSFPPVFRSAGEHIDDDWWDGTTNEIAPNTQDNPKYKIADEGLYTVVVTADSDVKSTQVQVLYHIGQ